MKIGIVTFWNSDNNYGQIFQGFALQNYLKELGHDACILRYSHSSPSFSLKSLTPINVYRSLRATIKKCKTFFHKGPKHNFEKFRNKVTFSEKKYDTLNELESEDWTNYDAFICGSDQVWITNSDVYFLQFAPSHALKIAYAPSFGKTTLNKEFQEALPKRLETFDSISVREDSGVEIVRKAGFEAELVCDPTLLYDKEFYLDSIGKKGSLEKNTVFCYLLNYCNLEPFCKEIAEFCNRESLTPVVFNIKGFKSKWLSSHKIQSPEEWLSQLYDAKYSVTNSFHGLVFSIIFHKNFAVYLHTGRAASINTRLISLLKIVGLSDRIVTEENKLEDILNREIDWDDIDKSLSNYRKASIDYLKKALSSRHK